MCMHVCVCSYDVILLSGVDKILEHFLQFEARVVFSAEGFCWPDEGLASKYPSVQRGKRYLNSGGMGSVSTQSCLVVSFFFLIVVNLCQCIQFSANEHSVPFLFSFIGYTVVLKADVHTLTLIRI
jgi:hypothetical protein